MNNPPAFPRPETDENLGSPGMTLRDWFAGQALAGLTGKTASKEVITSNAYIMADAMLAEREKRQ